MFIYNYEIIQMHNDCIHVKFRSPTFELNRNIQFERLFFNRYDGPHYNALKNRFITKQGCEFISYIETLHGISSFTLYKHETFPNTFCMNIHIENALVPIDDVISALNLLFNNSNINFFFIKARSLKHYVNRDYFYFNKKERREHVNVDLTFANVITKNKKQFNINSIININQIRFTRFGRKYIVKYLSSLQENTQLMHHFHLLTVFPYTVNIIFRNAIAVNILIQGFTMREFNQFTMEPYNESPVLRYNMNHPSE